MTSTLNAYRNYFFAGNWDTRLADMYGTREVDMQRDRYLKLINMASTTEIDKDMPVNLFSACGRAELGGNHTDHNLGNVLAAGVQLDIIAAVQPTSDMVVTIHSESFAPIRVDLSDLEIHPEEAGTPDAIIRGVACGLKKRGYQVAGFLGSVTSTIPVGSGLSSSAAFEVLISCIFNTLSNNGKISTLETALVAKEAENLHFGKPCGFMDQIACAFNGILHIDFNDPDQPVIIPVKLNFEDHGYQLAIINSGGDHANLTDEYAAIPAEMFEASRSLGKDFGRDITLDELMAGAKKIRIEAGDRAFLRLYHFINENKRAIEQAEVLQQGDLSAFLHLARASADSSYRFLQNCASIKDHHSQPIPVALAMSEHFLKGDGMSRVHGGGFAGTIQALVPLSQFNEYKQYMEIVFGADSVIPLHIRQPGFSSFQL